MPWRCIFRWIVKANATRFMCGLFTIEFQNKFRPINHRQRRHMTFVNQSLSMLPLSYVDIKINKNKQIRWLLDWLAYLIKRDLQSLTTCFSSKWASPFGSYWKKPPFGCQWSNYSSNLLIGAWSESRKPEEWVVLEKKKMLENRALDQIMNQFSAWIVWRSCYKFFSLTPKR